MKITSKLILSAIALMVTAVCAPAQDNANPPGGRDGNRGDRGNFNPEDFRKRMNERLKESLKASDDEWAVIQPLIEKVQTTQREAMGGGRGGFGGRGRGQGGPGGRGGNGGGGDRPETPGAVANTALREAVESDSTTPEELKAKIAAVREVRKKAEAELTAARAELVKVLSVRQEAALVSMGILE
ncbi:MAG: hypothetical protein ABI680_19745 [Chthoniobacteraceae bacterium]